MDTALIRFRLSHIDAITSWRDDERYDVRQTPFTTDPLRAVPQLRIYGATDSGQRVCAHVHGVFPYLYVQYGGSLHPDAVNAYIRTLGRSLNAALASQFPTKTGHEEPQIVAFIVLCKGIPFYGYHVGYQHYLKIYLADARYKKAVGEVLRAGILMNSTRFEVFEEHLNMILQFMLDANLFGCGWVEVGRQASFRLPLPAHVVTEQEAYDPAVSTGPFATRIYDAQTVSIENQHAENDVDADKISYCTLELDFSVESILNRHLVGARQQQQDFVELLQPESIETDKLVHSVKELWDDERRRRSAKGESGPNDVVDADLTTPRRWDTKAPGEFTWKSEPVWRDKIDVRVATDLEDYHSLPGHSARVPDFATFVAESARIARVEKEREKEVRTTFAQVEALYPGRMALDERERYEYGAWAVRKARDDEGNPFAASPSRAKGKGRALDQVNLDEEALRAWIAQRKGGRPYAGRGKGPAEVDLDVNIKEESDDEGYPNLDPLQMTQAQRNEARGGLADSEEELEEEEEERERIEQEVTASDVEIVEFGVDAITEVEVEQIGELMEEFEEFDGEVDMDDEVDGRPTKKQRIASSSVVSPIAPRSSNPFSSLTRSPRFKIAGPITFAMEEDNSSVLDHRDDDAMYDGASVTSGSQDHSGSLAPTTIRTEMCFDDLPADAFDDYHSTPTPSLTLHQSAPSLVPLHLRSFIGSDPALELEQPAAERPESVTLSLSISSLVETPLPTPSGGSIDSRKRVTFAVLEDGDAPSSSRTSVVRSSRSQSDASTASIRGDPALMGSISSSNSSNTRLRKQERARLFAKNCYAWIAPPPTTRELLDGMARHHEPDVAYRSPFYGKPEDVPYTMTAKGTKNLKRREYAGRTFIIKGDTIKYKKIFQHASTPKLVLPPVGKQRSGIKSWEFASAPPSAAEVQRWLASDQDAGAVKAGSQIEGPTQLNGGFHAVSVKDAESAVKEKQHLAILAMELHVNTRGHLLPDPAHDQIQAIFYCFQTENDEVVKNGRDPDSSRHVGVIAVGDSTLASRLGHLGVFLEVVETELELITRFVLKVRNEWDPEIFAGFEVHRASWGYMLERTETIYFEDPIVGHIVDALGRLSRTNTGKHGSSTSDRWGFTQSSTLDFSGRHVLPIWRILKEDLKLTGYTFENIAFHVLRYRTPHFSHETLTRWHDSGNPQLLARVFGYWRNRVEMDIEMLEEGDIISQTCEFARVFGVDFKSVRLRGSQFKVESVMFRIAKPENFLLFSPDRAQVGKQNAAECTPLIEEPSSSFYKGPLLVLDFQSLYPSVMIAYNYCYSTCVGRIDSFKDTTKLGVTTYDAPPGLLALVKDRLNISPNGLMFVKPEVRRSLLAKMLTELLDTRVMVKESMKLCKDDKALSKLMNARQLGLKLLANVTYGYTSATFSGRMPCVEIADAIVQTGRETLERAIETIHKTSRWGAEVVYGDTDSLFVHLPGKSKEDAFRIGQEIVDIVTDQNPRPIKLKFEKVYLPSVLLAKKRYVGFKYEHLSDLEPEFDAKGIETVRRDGFPALQMMQEKCLKILFRTQDLSQVKAYCQQQWTQILLGKVSAQDFIYAKEVKLGKYSDRVNPPPGAALAARKMKADSRAEPEYGERVPYILFNHGRGETQVNKAVSPEEFLADRRMRLDAEHYIVARLIPPLERIFNLLGADVKLWYTTMPKVDRLVRSSGDEGAPAVLLDEHFVSDRCLSCDRQHGGADRLCSSCLGDPATTMYNMGARTRQLELKRAAFHRICNSCSSTAPAAVVECTSVDCPIYYSRIRIARQIDELVQIL